MSYPSSPSCVAQAIGPASALVKYDSVTVSDLTTQARSPGTLGVVAGKHGRRCAWNQTNVSSHVHTERQVVPWVGPGCSYAP